MFKVWSRLAASERILVRFGATVLASLARLVFSFGSGVLTARGLGAAHYGDLTFLMASFSAIGQLTDMGSASAFYTFLSRRTRTLKFLSLYILWVFSQFILTFLIVGVVLPSSVIHHLWVGHDRGMVLLSLIATFLANDAWATAVQLGEARRKTVLVQSTSVLLAALHLLLIAIATYKGYLTVKTVFVFIICEYVVLLGLYGPKLIRLNLQVEPETGETAGNILKEYIGYCRPLVVYSWIGFVFTMFDRWLLQRFGGSAEQGYFSVALQFSTIGTIMATSIGQVFWKEFAEAHHKSDNVRMKYLCHSTGKNMYFICAWIGCLFIPYAREILLNTVGKSYESAILPLTLMFIYPLHQALSHVYSGALYASQKTHVHARIVNIMMIIGIPISYFILASPSAPLPGFGLGAIGLASKMVAWQMVCVNWEIYVISRMNGWPFHFLHQITALAALLALGWAGRTADVFLSGWLPLLKKPFPFMIGGGLVYIFFSASLFYRFPQLFGLKKEDVERIRQGARKILGHILPAAEAR